MSDQLSILMQRRVELLAKIGAQREQIGRIGATLETPLATADRVVAVLRYIRSRPLLFTSVVALFLARRRGILTLTTVVWRIWRGYRQLTEFSKKLSAGN